MCLWNDYFISTSNNIEKFIKMVNNWDILSFICEFWFILNLLVLLKYDDVKSINSLIVLFKNNKLIIKN